MRQTFKPLRRRESKAFALRRQALKQNLEDTTTVEDATTMEDRLEDINSFWDAATSRIQLPKDESLNYKKEDEFLNYEKEDEFLNYKKKNELSSEKNELSSKKEDVQIFKNEDLISEKGKFLDAEKENENSRLSFQSELLMKLKKKSLIDGFNEEIKNADISGISESAVLVGNESCFLEDGEGKKYDFKRLDLNENVNGDIFDGDFKNNDLQNSDFKNNDFNENSDFNEISEIKNNDLIKNKNDLNKNKNEKNDLIKDKNKMNDVIKNKNNEIKNKKHKINEVTNNKKKTNSKNNDVLKNKEKKKNINKNKEIKKKDAKPKKSVRYDFDAMQIIESSQINISPQHEKTEESPKKIKLSPVKSSLDASLHIKQNDQLFYVQNVEKLNTLKNQVIFLINTGDVETGMLFLKNESYVEPSTADRSFSLIVLKGGVKIVINGKETELKKNGICVVQKGMVYGIYNINGYSSSVFISYAIN